MKFSAENIKEIADTIRSFDYRLKVEESPEMGYVKVITDWLPRYQLDRLIEIASTYHRMVEIRPYFNQLHFIIS